MPSFVYVRCGIRRVRTWHHAVAFWVLPDDYTPDQAAKLGADIAETVQRWFEWKSDGHRAICRVYHQAAVVILPDDRAAELLTDDAAYGRTDLSRFKPCRPPAAFMGDPSYE